MASGAKYNQQAWKELGALPPTPPPLTLQQFGQSEEWQLEGSQLKVFQQC